MSLPPGSPQDVGIDYQIEGDDEYTECNLDIAGERGGVEKRQDVMLDEATRVSRTAGLAPEPVLQRCEGTDPAAKLDRGSPDSGGNVQVREPGPPQHQQPAEQDEEHEEKVDHDDKISEQRREAGYLRTSPLPRVPAIHLTAYTGGRCSATVCHESPWSTVTQSDPVVVPKAR